MTTGSISMVGHGIKKYLNINKMDTSREQELKHTGGLLWSPAGYDDIP